MTILRLNYAIDVRYGVLLDIATRVRRGDAVPLEMGFVNVIWQGDANRIAIEALAQTSAPPFIVNLTGDATLSVRDLANRFASRFATRAVFTGTESDDALLSNTTLLRRSFAPPETSIDRMIDHVADWIERGGPTLHKPTHFETRDGTF